MQLTGAAAALCRLMADSHVKRARGGSQRNAQQTAALDQFVASACAMQLGSALGPKEAAFLSSFQTVAR